MSGRWWIKIYCNWSRETFWLPRITLVAQTDSREHSTQRESENSLNCFQRRRWLLVKILQFELPRACHRRLFTIWLWLDAWLSCLQRDMALPPSRPCPTGESSQVTWQEHETLFFCFYFRQKNCENPSRSVSRVSGGVRFYFNDLSESKSYFHDCPPPIYFCDTENMKKEAKLLIGSLLMNFNERSRGARRSRTSAFT